MFGVGGIGNLMKQVQDVQAKMQEMQKDVAKLQAEGSSGAGLVTATINGQFQLQSLDIDDSLLEDKAMMEDLIRSAVNSAVSTMEVKKAEEVKKVTGGLELPEGMKFPFS